ncbi:hypothetical protein NX059_008503 [Plenodomus lindquistii]|nr:hypothetical protein NX059_008503 [Plenodomus lindquistii]
MSGLSARDAVSLIDDYIDPTTSEEDEVEIQEYAADEACDDDDDDDGGGLYEEAGSIAPRDSESIPATFEIPSISLDCGEVRVGTVLELKDRTDRKFRRLMSGDFVLVRKIIEDTETCEVTIKGHLLRRVQYLQPLFTAKPNDLFMLIKTQEGDDRDRFTQGLVNVSQDEVVKVRQCVFTHYRHEEFGHRHVNRFVPARLKTDADRRDWLFHSGALICRWVHVLDLEPDGKSYGGEVRRMYKREVEEFSVKAFQSVAPNLSVSRPNSSRLNTKRAFEWEDSVEESRAPKRPHHPQKPRVQTMADGFCCAGGVSLGAQQAGYKVVWGLEKDPIAMTAYKRNFPGARHYEMCAHDFPWIADRCIHGCDHLHMSCPCCYWSICHTVAGRNDQENMETLYTVAAWLEKLKPKTFSLEQAPGLIQKKEHKMYFRSLLNQILDRGYGIRWKVQDQT